MWDMGVAILDGGQIPEPNEYSKDDAVDKEVEDKGVSERDEQDGSADPED